MKTFAILAATFAGAALAQETPMPSGECAKLCINNMARIASSEFQCAQDDLACFCTRSNWAYGIRDCSNQACDSAQSASAVAWAYARCEGVAATASNQPEALPILTSAVASATGAPNNQESMMSSITSELSAQPSGFVSSILSDAQSALESLSSAASEALESATDALASATESLSPTATETKAEGAAAPRMTGMSLAAGAGVAAWLLL